MISFEKSESNQLARGITERVEVKEKRDQQEFLKRSLEGNNGVLYGSFAPQIICPHCQTKGKVRKKMEQRVEESREKGIIGATIGRKTITKKGSYTQLHCDKCKVTWEA